MVEVNVPAGVVNLVNHWVLMKLSIVWLMVNNCKMSPFLVKFYPEFFFFVTDKIRIASQGSRNI